MESGIAARQSNSRSRILSFPLFEFYSLSFFTIRIQVEGQNVATLSIEDLAVIVRERDCMRLLLLSPAPDGSPRSLIIHYRDYPVLRISFRSG